MSVTLVFPPPFDISQPYLSLPVLTGYLRRSGVDVQQRDLNLEFYESFLSKDSLRSVFATLLQREGFRSPVQSRAQALWQQRSLAILPTLIDHIEGAKSRIREPLSFLDARGYARDIRYLHRACEALSSLHFPTRITLNTFSMRYRTSSIAEMVCAAQDETENPFIQFLRNGVVASLLGQDPTLVGMSVVYTDQLIPAITIAREIKRSHPVPLFVGGEVMSRMARSNNGEMGDLFDFFDGIIVDDGSEPLLRLHEAVSGGRDVGSVPRILTRSNGAIPTPHPTPMPSLDALGRPDFDGLRLDSYFSPDVIMPILSGKGCEWGRCVFCTESFTKSFATRSIDQLLDDVEYLVKSYNIRYLTFADSDVPPRRLHEIADGFITRNIDVSWSCYARLTPQLTPHIIETLSESGCSQIYFGLETASQRLLNLMRKGIRIDRVPALLRLCHDYGIFTHLFCFVGFPGETKDEAWSTAHFIEDHLSLIGSFNIGAFSFRTFSEVFEQREEYGVMMLPQVNVDGDADNHAYEVSNGLSMEEAETLAKDLVSYISNVMKEQRIPHTCYRASGYVIRRHVPAWQSHSLFYLSNKLRVGDTVAALDHDDIESFTNAPPDVRNMIILDDDGHASVIFCPDTGRILRVRKRELSLKS